MSLSKQYGSQRFLNFRNKRLIAPHNLITFDTETNGLNGKLLALTATCEVRESFLDEYGATQILNTQETIYYYGEGMVERFFGALFHNLSHLEDYYVYAHNAQYDWRYLFDYVSDFYALGVISELQIIARSSSDILAFSFKHRNCIFHFLDSMAIAPMSLKKFSNEMSPDIAKLDGEIDFENGEIFDPHNPMHVAYAKRDSLSLWHSLINYQNFLRGIFGVNIQMTSASTAMLAWENTLTEVIPFDEHITDTHFLSACQQAYYGGAVFLTSTKEQQDVVTYDINSSYPAVMESVKFPDDEYLSFYEGNKIFSSDEVCQIIFAFVETPENLRIPILPTRRRKDKGAIVWPRGNFFTMTTNVELELALKHGYKAEVFASWCAPLVESPFKKLVGLCKETRKKYKGGPLETVAKLMQNSLYGKFATKTVRTAVDTESTQFLDEHADRMSPEEQMRFRIDNNIDGEYPFSFKDEDTGHATRRKIIYAAWITAHARKRLFDFIYTAGPENVIYGDTDSVTMLEKASPKIQHFLDNAEYGKFKLEKEWHTFKVIAPKVYTGELKGLDSGGNAKGFSGKVKGIPKKHIKKVDGYYEKLHKNKEMLTEKVYYESAPAFVQILKGNKESACGPLVLKRTVSDINNSLSWVPNEDGSVSPIEIQLPKPDGSISNIELLNLKLYGASPATVGNES